ncbi:transmembrane protein 272 [Biomphalaria glabrata]|uniref:Uncharacterized protein n=1 Tax=Biomphalaria glabrata TaxID=6526 RepID=A0A2C9K805_BIOGL|nr:transmembrane protein 272 [Biomphalaria glabrata]
MCALKDELRVGSEGGDEVNEMTAMTPSPTDGEEVTLENNNLFTSSTERGKAYFRRMKSPKLLCLSGVLSLFLLAYTLAKIIMGSSYLDYCPADPFIPIYLIISGCLTFIIIFIIYVIVYVRTKKKDNDTLTSTVYLVAFVYLFIHIVLHLAGSVCVIVKEKHIKDLRLSNVTGESVTCSETLIDFSLGLVIFELVVIGVIFIITGLFIAEAIREVCCPKYSAVPSPHSPTTVIVNDNYMPPT